MNYFKTLYGQSTLRPSIFNTTKSWKFLQVWDSNSSPHKGPSEGKCQTSEHTRGWVSKNCLVWALETAGATL